MAAISELNAIIEIVETTGVTKDLEAWLTKNGENVRMEDGGVPLLVAVVTGSEESTRVIVRMRGDVNFQLPHNGFTALHYASQFGWEEIVAILLASSADFHLQTKGHSVHLGQTSKVYFPGGRIPLHLAAENGHSNVCKLLLDAGTDPLSEDDFATTPHHLAMEQAVLAKNETTADKFFSCVRLLNKEVSTIPTTEEVKAAKLERERALRKKISENVEREEWEKKDKYTLQLRSYIPKHPEVFLSSLSPTCFSPPSFAAKSSVDPLDACVTEPLRGVYSFPLLSPDFARKIYEEINWYETQATEGGALPLLYRHDGNLGSFQDCGFDPLLKALNESVMTPVVEKLFPYMGRVECYHAFCTRNYVGRTETFKIHQDKAQLTLNICLHKTPDLLGSGVSFFPKGEDAGKVPSPEDVCYIYDHEIGHAVVHDGSQWHQTNPIERGERASLIVWTRSCSF